MLFFFLLFIAYDSLIQVMGGNVTITRGSNITELTRQSRSRHHTDDSSLGSFKFEVLGRCTKIHTNRIVVFLFLSNRLSRLLHCSMFIRIIE